MYSNSKEQINLENVYRSVHVEKLQEETDDSDLSQVSDTFEQGYKAISNSFLTNTGFRDKVLKYWINPAIEIASQNLSRNGSNDTLKFKNDVDKQRLSNELIKNDEILMVLDKLHKMDKDHQHNTPQYINYQRSLAHKIESHLGKEDSHNSLSTYRKPTTFG
jgi:hypothetical protein